MSKVRTKFSAKLAKVYTKFRGSPLFLIALTVLITAWLVVHFVYGEDADFGALNLVLSSEATLTTALVMMILEKNEAAQRRAEEERQRAEQRHAEQLTYMGHLLKAILEDTERIPHD